MDAWIAFTVLIFALCTLHTTCGIKCWVCRSNLDPKCADPFDNTTLPINDCDKEKLVHLPNLKASMCRKTRQKVYGEWRFIRDCAYLGRPGEGTGNENYCTARTGTYNVFVETCTCNSKDGCNSATSLHSAFSSFVIFFLFLLVR